MDSSAKVYSRLVLRFYDFWVLSLSNTYAWHCPTKSVLLPFYQSHLGEGAHLEVGVGTGYYPANSVASLQKTKAVTLLDLNPNTLAYAKERLGRAGYKGTIETLEHNVFAPFPESARGTFDSIVLFYVFHCLPGALPAKAAEVFKSLAPGLAPGGVLYGSTILGSGVKYNFFGRRLMGVYNKKGIFGNREDSEEGLKEALAAVFEEYEVRVVGKVALFSGKNPKAIVG